MNEIKYFFKELGEETETRKTFSDETAEATPAIDFIFSTFRTHLKNCGFTDEIIKEYADIYFGE